MPAGRQRAAAAREPAANGPAKAPPAGGKAGKGVQGAQRRAAAQPGPADRADFPPLPQGGARRIAPTPVQQHAPVATPAGGAWRGGLAGGGGFSSVAAVTPVRRGSQPSTPLGTAAAQASPFAIGSPLPGDPAAALAGSPSLERLMSGAGLAERSPAARAGPKARAATQLVYTGGANQQAFKQTSLAALTSPQKRRQAPRPVGNALDVRLGKAPDIQAAGRQAGHTANGVSAGRPAAAGSKQPLKPPRRINPQQLQQPPPPAPPPLRSGMSAWPAPAAQLSSQPNTNRAAWGQAATARAPVSSPLVTAASAALATPQPESSSSRATSAAAADAAANAQEAGSAAAPDAAAADSSMSPGIAAQTGQPSSASGSAPAAAASQPQAQTLNAAERLLRAGRLGILCGRPLRRGTAVALAPELDLLLQLLALPADVDVKEAVLLNCTRVAAAFAGAAMLEAGGALTLQQQLAVELQDNCSALRWPTCFSLHSSVMEPRGSCSERVYVQWL